METCPRNPPDLTAAGFVRAGVRVLQQQLRSWIATWTCHHTAGMPVSGALTQLRAALLRGSKAVVQLHVSAFFDSVTLPNLRRVLEHLRTPSASSACRGPTLTAGGEPRLALAGTFTFLWACYAFQRCLHQQVGGCGYVDDRTVWLEPGAPTLR